MMRRIQDRPARLYKIDQPDCIGWIFIAKKILISIFLFIVPLLIYPCNTEYSYTKIIFAFMFISLILLIWAYEILRQGKRGTTINYTGLLFPFLALLLAMSLSMVNTQSLRLSLWSIAIFLYFFIFFLFLANTVERKSDIYLCLRIILASAVLSGIYGLLQYYEILPGHPHPNIKSVLMISTLGNKNYLGGFLVYLFFPTLALLFGSTGKATKIFTLVSLSIVLSALIAVNSDGVWLALIVSGILLIIGLAYFGLFRFLYQSRNRIWGITMIITVLAVILIHPAPIRMNSQVNFANEPGQQPQQEGRVNSEGCLKPLRNIINKPSTNVRIEDWWISCEMFRDHPIIGIGIANYKVEFLPYKAKFLSTPRGDTFKNFYIVRTENAHNEYIQIAAEMGILGILAAGYAIVIIFLSGFKGIKQERSVESKFIRLCLLVGVVALLAHALVSFPLHLPASSLDLALLLGLLNSRYFDENKSHTVKLGQREIEAISVGAFVLTIIVVTIATRDFLADVDVNAGRAYLLQGCDERAESLLLESINLDFQPLEAYHLLGSMYARHGQYERCLQFYNLSRKSYITESTYWYLGTCNLSLKNYDQAFRYLKMLAATYPEKNIKRYLIQYLDVFYRYGMTKLNQGEEDEQVLDLFDKLAAIGVYLDWHKQPKVDYLRAILRKHFVKAHIASHEGGL